MKTRTNTYSAAICLFAGLLLPSHPAAARTPNPAAINATNFAVIGITRGQTLQINVAAYPPAPCFAQLGVQDSNGNPIGATSAVALQPGQSASLSINGNTLAGSVGERVEVLPFVVPTVIVCSAAIRPNQCVASVEIFDNVIGLTSVLIPGSTGWPLAPIFGTLGVTEFQTVRLNVVAYPPDPCIGQLSFVNSDGIQVGDALPVQIPPGQGLYMDLAGSTLVTKLGQREELRPVVTSSSGACVASTEVYINGLGTTAEYYQPDPCSQLNASCAVF
jgi:hypothetical protein